MSLNLESKREKEKQIVAKMISIYCKKSHGIKVGLCKNCKELKDYAFNCSDCCPFMETKMFCSNCKVHCYEPHMRAKIRTVMRFSGIRLLLYNPITAIRHIILSLKEKSQIYKNGKT